MRTESKVAAVWVVLLITACSKAPQQTSGLPDDLKRDLAAASAPSSDLATAPQGYRRMRFVSDLEQSKASVRASRPKVSLHRDRMAPSHQATADATTGVALDPVASMASAAPATVSTATAAAPEPSIVIAARPSPEPARSPAAPASEGTAGENVHGGGLGGMLGGIIGAVVIRGGHAGPDKCDPRTDGRARGTIADRPDFGMPVPTGQVFGGARRR